VIVTATVNVTVTVTVIVIVSATVTQTVTQTVTVIKMVTDTDFVIMSRMSRGHVATWSGAMKSSFPARSPASRRTNSPVSSRRVVLISSFPNVHNTGLINQAF
jgi:hypothetical protein